MRKLLAWNNRVLWFNTNGLPYGPENILLNQKNRFVKRFFMYYFLVLFGFLASSLALSSSITFWA